MKRLIVFWGCPLAVCLFFIPGHVSKPLAGPAQEPFDIRATKPNLHQRTRGPAESRYANLPLSFEANEGQADSRVRFIFRSPQYSWFLTSDAAVLSFCAQRRDQNQRVVRHLGAGQNKCEPEAMRMQLLGTNVGTQITAEEPLAGVSNYFRGSDRQQWHTGIRHYAKVRYRKIYSGIDLVYYGDQKRLEYDFVVAPGADPGKIRIALEDLNKTKVPAAARVIEDGILLVQAKWGEIHLEQPKAYQIRNGERNLVPVRYVIRKDTSVGFELGKYDRNQSITIDPVVGYSTFLGGSLDDFALAVAVDSSSNVYVTGGTTSLDFPVTSGVAQGTFGGSDSNVQGVRGDVFVSKLNAAGDTLAFSTYLGGTADDNAYGIAVDADGNAYLAGATNSSDFPVTTGSLQTTFGGGPDDAFVVKLNASGSGLAYSTYLGTSTGGERAFGIAVDTAGDAYVTGDAAPDFPVTSGIFNDGVNDAFVSDLNPAGTGFVFSILFGGNGLDQGSGIAVDSSGNVSVTGPTTSTDLPVTANAAQASLAGSAGVDAFVAQLDNTGSLLYCTYLGGNGDEDFNALGSIAVDTQGKIYVTGPTSSANFPTTGGAFQTTPGGGIDSFVTKLDPTKTSSMVYSTLLGGSGDEDAEEFGRGITVDAAGNAIVTGSTTSANFPTASIQSVLAGGEDAFVTKLNSTGSSLIFSAYTGGTGNDFGTGVAVDSVGNTYWVGQTGSADFPVSDAFQSTLGGSLDAFVFKGIADFGLGATPASASVSAGGITSFTVTADPIDGLYNAPISLACSGTPSLSTCSVSPTDVTPGASTASATITITTTGSASSSLSFLNSDGRAVFYAFGLPVMGLLAGAIGVRQRPHPLKRITALATFVLLGLLVLLPGCGGSSHPQQQGTPKGTYTITITGSSTTTHTTTVQLTVT